MSIHIDNLYQENEYDLEFAYIIDDIVYNALNLEAFAFDEEEIETTRGNLVEFDLDPLGSKPIGVKIYDSNSGLVFVLIF
jgi:hypothetical protein